MRKGFTLIEMTVSLMVFSVVILTIGNVITDSHSIWLKLYDNVFGTVSSEIINTERSFNSVCRKATLRNIYLSADKQTVCMYYFSNNLAPGYWPDRYYKYYLDGRQLKLQHGTLYFATETPYQALYTETICDNVDYLQFSIQGLSVQMCMTVNDGSRKKTFSWAAVRHN